MISDPALRRLAAVVVSCRSDWNIHVNTPKRCIIVTDGDTFLEMTLGPSDELSWQMGDSGFDDPDKGFEVASRLFGDDIERIYTLYSGSADFSAQEDALPELPGEKESGTTNRAGCWLKAIVVLIIVWIIGYFLAR